MTQVFIDANVYLSFYHLTGEDLEELEKVFVLNKAGQLRLILTQQVKDEFYRNRDGKIADALKLFQEEKFKSKIPNMAKAYNEQYDALLQGVKQFESAQAELIAKIKQDVAARELKADKTIAKLFEKADVVPLSDKLYMAALKRSRCGNPPGKKESIGDAINWECLLSAVPEASDLHVISDDGDFFSALDKEIPHSFLQKEWADVKKAELYAYRRLSKFMALKFPAAARAVELEKQLVVDAFSNSGSFATTHHYIAELDKIDDFTPAQIVQIINSYFQNNQINWIALDDDVNAFGKKIIERYRDIVDPALKEQFEELISPEDDSPF